MGDFCSFQILSKFYHKDNTKQILGSRLGPQTLDFSGNLSVTHQELKS